MDLEPQEPVQVGFEGPVGGEGCLRDNYFTFGGGRGIGFGNALMRSAGHG